MFRVRAQMRRLDEMLSRERDPLSLDRLARALAVLAEQERLLDGRPLPGSLRPRTRRSSQDAAQPLEPEDRQRLAGPILAPGIVFEG